MRIGDLVNSEGWRAPAGSASWRPAGSLAPCLALCGAGHFTADFACALTVLSLPTFWGLADRDYYALVILYNLVAFGSQPFWGWLLDRRSGFRPGMSAGLLLTGLGAAGATLHPVAAVLLLAIGNALFHVGAGALVYGAAPGRAAGPGLFVAPGGIGLFAGITLGMRGAFPPLWLAPVLLAGAFALYRLVPEPRGTALPDQGRAPLGASLSLLVPLFLTVVALRSFAGFALPVPWKGGGNGMLFLVLAAFAGKASGGYLADRLGWRVLCGFMLTAAAALGLAHQGSLPAACAALFCIQCTTGVTLAGVQNLFPGRPGFAFGLPCIALLVGALPFYLPHPLGRIAPGLALAVCLCAALAAAAALRPSLPPGGGGAG